MTDKLHLLSLHISLKMNFYLYNKLCRREMPIMKFNEKSSVS